MKTTNLSQINWNRRISLRKQEIQGITCEEFAKNSLDANGNKVGYDPFHKSCIGCTASLICMELGSYAEKENRINLVKSQLQLPYFYDENKIKEKGFTVIKKLLMAVKQYHEQGKVLTEDHLDRAIDKLVDEELKSLDPEIPVIVKQVLIDSGVEIKNNLVTYAGE